MSVSKDFLNKLDELLMFSDEPCLCDGIVCCRSCEANIVLESLYSEIEDAVGRIKDNQQSIS